jgi:hypothetical protein
MTSLVDRYVFTALRRVPEAQRADIDRELRASIDDAVDARVEAGEPREAAVEKTLLELGDPDRLADQYANRPNYLLGPELFPAWRRLMMLMITTVLPIVVGVTIALQLFDDPEIGKVIGVAVSAILNVGVHLAFWTTLVFVIIERTGAGTAGLRTTWTLKDLPTYERSRQSLTQLAAGLVWPVLMIAALVLQQFTFTDVPVLNPANWSFWWPFLIVVLLLEGAYAVWLHRLGTPTRATAAVNAVLSLLSAVPMVWLLATDRFFNPAFDLFVEVGTGDSKQWLTGITITVVVLSSVWDIADGILRAERARRGLPTKVAGSGNTYTLV